MYEPPHVTSTAGQIQIIPNTGCDAATSPPGADDPAVHRQSLVEIQKHMEHIKRRLDQIIAASGGDNGSRGGGSCIDIGDDRSGVSLRTAHNNNMGDTVNGTRKGRCDDNGSDARAIKVDRSLRSAGTSGDQTETTDLTDVRSLLESIAQSEELKT